MKFKIKKTIGIIALGLAILTPTVASASTMIGRRPMGEIISKGLTVSGYGFENAEAWTKSSYGYAQVGIVTFVPGGPNKTAASKYDANGNARVKHNTAWVESVSYASHSTLDESAVTDRKN